jgi:ADP-heptose:LPS heptosyltransferase
VNVVIARFLAFGDVLLTLPLAEALRRNPAVRRVDLVTSAEFAGVPRISGFFDTVHPAGGGAETGLASRSYDLLIDLHARSVPLPESCERSLAAVHAERTVRFATQWGDRRNGELPTRGWHEHAVEYYARAAGDLVTAPLPDGRVRFPADAREWAAAQDVTDVVCVSPGARYGFKRWPEASYGELVRLLRVRGVEAVLVGHRFDAEVVTRIAAEADCRYVLDSDELRLGALMQRAGVVVTNNTGLLHLAQVSGARCVCIHSHTSPDMWRPWGSGHVNLVGAAHPCDCPDIGAFEAPFPCGKRIDPRDVAEAVAQVAPNRVAGGVGR